MDRSMMRLLALAGVLALAATACRPGVPEDVELGVGVTEEACPDAVNPDNGCIYLGVLSDLTVGPFKDFGPELLAGQRAFWQRVNEEGGIGGRFDVNIDSYTRDTQYNPQIHRDAFDEIAPNVLGLSETLGTPTTLAIRGPMNRDDIVGAVSTWWSGWEFENNILNAGANYCLAAMNGVEWASEEFEAVATILPVVFPGDYGGDALAGVRIAANALGLEMLDPVTQIPKIAGGDTTGAVSTIVERAPSLVFLAVGPQEAGEIVGGAAAREYAGQFVASHPSFHHGLLASPAGPAFTAQFTIAGPHENWGGTSSGHSAMRDTRDGELPGNDGFTFGWVLAYPMKAALEHAAGAGDLTRPGLVAAVGEMSVDFEGMLPAKSYGDSNEDVVRQTTLSRPDSEAADRLGLTTIEAAYAGSVAQDFEFTEPCVEAG